MIQQVSKRYDAYRDSGVEWLGHVPESWTIVRLKDLGFLQNGISKSGDYFGSGFPFISYGNVYNNTISSEKIKTLANSTPEDQQAYSCKRGDVFFTRTSETIEEIGFSATCLKTIPKTVFSGFVIRFRPTTNDLVAEFSSFYFSANILRRFFINEIALVTRASLGQGLLNKLSVLLPTPPEQKAIANYLDDKTAKIDQQIDLLSQKAKHYGELKQALINETVTRGLDKTVPMKDSGIEWIGEIPAHWEVKRVKELGNLVLGKMLDNNQGSDKLLKPYLKSKNIGWLKVTDSNVEEMFFSPYEIKLYRLKKGDLLFSEGGEVGKTAYWNDEIEECFIQNSVHKFTVNKNSYSRYFLFLSFAAGRANYYDNIVNFVSIKHLTKEKLSRVVWLSPPPHEQKAIADYLDQKTAQIDAIVETITAQIDNLKALRKTLINDVVTGKICIL
ncbi:MAG: restriction endonuclease subunit S [Methylomonas sp.]|nr:restriction endonuclease subunit S [Methylomonas sp.]